MDAYFSPYCVVFVKIFFVNPKEDNETEENDNHHVRNLKTV